MVGLWTKLRGAIDPLVRPFNLYTAYTISNEEYIGERNEVIRNTRKWLNDNGYSPNFISAAKKHPETGKLHDLSYRKVANEHPEAVKGTKLEEYDPSHCQYHVHVFNQWHTSMVYSHYELRPWMHPIKHYKGKLYLAGVSDLDV